MKEDKGFIETHKADLCASIQSTIVDILLQKITEAVRQTGIQEIAIAGGVSANSHLRNELIRVGKSGNWKVFIPKLSYSTDNAAMIAIAGYFKFLKGDFAGQEVTPYARGT